MLVMTNRGLKSILKERVKLGIDVDTALITKGVGYSAESTARLRDVYSFSDNAGLFIGGSLEGTYLQPRNDLNKAFHNKEFLSDDILNDFKISKDIENLSIIIDRLNENKPKGEAIILCAHGSRDINYENDVKNLVSKLKKKNKKKKIFFFRFIEKNDPEISKCVFDVSREFKKILFFSSFIL